MSKTKDYYNSVSDLLLDIKYSYNIALILEDIDSDPSTFIEQNFNNVIKLSKLGNNVLECGCGTGYFFKQLIEKYPSINYHGFDFSVNQIKNAKLLNPEHEEKFSVVDWNLGLPFEDNSFDTLLFLETIGYTTNVEKLVTECHRVLKPGGTLFSKHPGCIKSFYYRFPQKDLNSYIKELSVEHGYEDNSLGMLMDVPNFIKVLEKYNFFIPDGFQIPIIDTGFHIKSYFKEEIKPYLINLKLNSKRFTSYLPSKIPKFLDWENMTNDLGKLHPRFIELIKNDIFGNRNNIQNLPKEQIFEPCVVFTAYKK